VLNKNIMEGIILLVIIGLLLTFGEQLLKGVSNIFSIAGRIGGWVLGIIIFIILVKVFLFG